MTDYREEWAQLEALGVDGVVALMQEHASAERTEAMNKTSRFRGVSKANGGKGPKLWAAQIGVTEDGKPRHIHIGYFAREEDAARAYDRVSIAKLGHAKAKTNFPVVKYRAEWVQLEALGAEGAVARERRRVQQQAPRGADHKDKGPSAGRCTLMTPPRQSTPRGPRRGRLCLRRNHSRPPFHHLGRRLGPSGSARRTPTDRSLSGNRGGKRCRIRAGVGSPGSPRAGSPRALGRDDRRCPGHARNNNTNRVRNITATLA